MKSTTLNILFRQCAFMMMVITITMAHAQEIEVYQVETPPAAVQLRNNGLFDLLLCPNVGVEIQTDIALAWQLDYIGAWWNSPSNNRFYSNYMFQTELRYYLDNNTHMPYHKHHVGVYGLMATYDFEFGGKGRMSRDLDFTFGIGISYGYAWVLSQHWNIDVTVGIGYLQSKYDIYNPTTEGYLKDETRRQKFWGPTKVELTLVWNINTKNASKKNRPCH